MSLDSAHYSRVGQVTGIYVSRPEKVTPRSLYEGCFEENHGLIGDKHSSSGDRQVTILSAEGRAKIETIERDGLCAKRFYENITVKDLDVSKLIIGQELIIGEAIFQITGIGKRCFPECDIVQRQQVCSLKNGVVFAKVIISGTVTVGDEVLFRE